MRILFSTIFALAIIAVALFLLQKQSSQYNFSVQQEKEAWKGFGDGIEEFSEDMPSQKGFEEFVQELQKLQPEGTTTTEAATSTGEEAVLIPKDAVE